jgi:membrane protease YdiL (CAAX protease family)
MQVVMTFAVAALWLFGGIPAASLGVRIPHAWAANIAVGGLIASYFAFTAIRRRSRAHDLRERMRTRGGRMLLPDTHSELRYFAALCAGSGVAEELVYRGLLMFLIAHYAPRLTIVVVALGGVRTWARLSRMAWCDVNRTFWLDPDDPLRSQRQHSSASRDSFRR